VRPTPTAEDYLAAVHFQGFDRHHTLEVMLDIVEQDIFIFHTVHARTETSPERLMDG